MGASRANPPIDDNPPLRNNLRRFRAYSQRVDEDCIVTIEPWRGPWAIHVIHCEQTGVYGTRNVARAKQNGPVLFARGRFRLDGGVAFNRFAAVLRLLGASWRFLALLTAYWRTQSTKYSGRPSTSSTTSPWMSVWNPGKRSLKSRANRRYSMMAALKRSPGISSGIPGG